MKKKRLNAILVGVDILLHTLEDVTDWDGVRSALAARGVGVGAIHHKPELDE